MQWKCGMAYRIDALLTAPLALTTDTHVQTFGAGEGGACVAGVSIYTSCSMRSSA